MHKKFHKFGKESTHKKLKCKKHDIEKIRDHKDHKLVVTNDKKSKKSEEYEKEYLMRKHKEKKRRKLLEKLEKNRYVEQYLQNLNSNPKKTRKHFLSSSLDRETGVKHDKYKFRKEKTFVEPNYSNDYKPKTDYIPEERQTENNRHKKRRSERRQDSAKGMNPNVFYCQIQPTPQLVANNKHKYLYPPEKTKHLSKKDQNNREDQTFSHHKRSHKELKRESLSRSPKHSNRKHRIEGEEVVRSKSSHSLYRYEKYQTYDNKPGDERVRHEHQKRESSKKQRKERSSKKPTHPEEIRKNNDEVEEKLKQKLEEDLKHYFAKIQMLIDKKLDGILCTKSKMKVREDHGTEVKKTHKRTDSRTKPKESSQCNENKEEQSTKTFRKRSQSSRPNRNPKQSNDELDENKHQLRRYKSPLPIMNAELKHQHDKIKTKPVLVPEFDEIRTRHYNSLSSFPRSSENIPQQPCDSDNEHKFIVEGVEPPNFESPKGKQRPRPRTQINLECKTISIFGIPSTVTKEAVITVNQTQTSNSLNINKPHEDEVEERKKTRRFQAYYKYSVGDTAKHSSDSSEIKSIVSDSHRAISDPSDVEEQPIKQPRMMQITIPEYYFKKRKHRIATPVDSKLNNISEETSNDSSKKNKPKKNDQVECKYFRTLPSSNSDYSLRIVPKSAHSNVSIQSKEGHKQPKFPQYFIRQVNLPSSMSSISIAKSASKEVIKLYKSFSDISNEIRIKTKDNYYNKEIRKLYEAKPRVHNIKKDKYLEEVDRYFERHNFLRDIAKKIEEEEQRAKREQRIKENMAGLFWKELHRNTQKEDKTVASTSPQEGYEGRKVCMACCGSQKNTKDFSSKEESTVITTPVKSNSKNPTTRSVAIEVTGPVLPISVDVGVEVSPQPSQSEKLTVETKDACIGVTPKNSPRMVNENAGRKTVRQDESIVKTEKTIVTERPRRPQREEKSENSPKTPKVSPRICSPKKQVKNLTAENKYTSKISPRSVYTTKAESVKPVINSPIKEKSKVNLNLRKSKSKQNLTKDRSKLDIPDVKSKEKLKPCSAGDKQMSVFDRKTRNLVRSSSLMIVSSQKKCLALDISKSEVGFKQSKITSLVCFDKLGNKSKYPPKSITEHSLDRFASTTSSNRYFGSSRLYTKDYKGNNDISSYQKRKIYDEEMRKKIRKKVQKENNNPQIFEVRYLTTTIDENINTEDIGKEHKIIEEPKIISPAKEDLSEKPNLPNEFDDKAFELFKLFLSWNQQKNPSQFCDHCDSNKNLESVAEFLYEYASAKENPTTFDKNVIESSPKRIQISKNTNREIATKKGMEKLKNELKEESKKAVKKNEPNKPEIINYFPQESRLKMYHAFQKRQQAYEVNTSFNSDDEKSEEMFVINPTSLPRVNTKDSSFEFMYEDDYNENFSKQSAISLLTRLQVPDMQHDVKQFNVEVEEIPNNDVDTPKSCSGESGYSSVASKNAISKRDFFKMPCIAALFNRPDECSVSVSDNSIQDSFNDELIINKKTSSACGDSQEVDFDLELVLSKSEDCNQDITTSTIPIEQTILDTSESHPCNLFPPKDMNYDEMSKNCQLYAQKVRENSEINNQSTSDYEEIPLDVLLNKNSSCILQVDALIQKSVEYIKETEEEIINCKIVLSNETLRTDSVTFLTDVFSQKVLPNVTEDCEKIQLDDICNTPRSRDHFSDFNNPTKLKQLMAKKFFRNLLSVYEKEMDISKRLCEDKFFEKQLLESIETLEMTKLPKKPRRSIRSFFRKFKSHKESKKVKNEFEDFEEVTTATVGNYLDESHQMKLRKLAYDARRYFTMFVQAVKVNQNINDEMKICGLLKLLQRIEKGDFTILRREEEVNFEQEIKEQIKRAFLSVYEVSSNEAKKCNRALAQEDIQLIRAFVSKYRIGLLSKTDIIASYIGRGVIKSEKQLKAAVTYLMGLQTTDIDLQNFEEYCRIE